MKKLILIIGLILIVIIIIIIVLCSSNDLITTRYTIENKKIKNNVKIVHLSDFHAGEYGDKQEDIVLEIKKEKPDLIVLSGDMIDEVGSISNTIELLDNIQDIAPTYYVAGNHEYRNDNVSEFFRYIKESKIKHLMDRNNKIRINGNDISICGLDDYTGASYWNREEDETIRMNKLWDESNDIKILLSHHPEMVDLYSKYKYDLIFSGHAHGGQVRFEPILKGIIAPNQGLLPKYTKGVYKLSEDTNLVVSVGLAKNKVPRINNKPEIVVVDLIKKGR